MTPIFQFPGHYLKHLKKKKALFFRISYWKLRDFRINNWINAKASNTLIPAGFFFSRSLSKIARSSLSPTLHFPLTNSRLVGR